MREIQRIGIGLSLMLLMAWNSYGQIITEEIEVQMNGGKTLIQDALEVEGDLEVTKPAIVWGDDTKVLDHHLELYSADTGEDDAYIGLYFHHGNQFGQMLRVRSSGFHFTGGGSFVNYRKLYANGFNQVSDNLYKKDVVTIPDPLTLISGLRGVCFKWKETEEPSVGFIAQEVREVLPELVAGDEGSLSVEYANIVAVAVEAIKALNEKVATLEAEIAALKEN